MFRIHPSVRHRGALLGALAALAVVLAACGAETTVSNSTPTASSAATAAPTEAGPLPQFPLTIADSGGHSVTLQAAPQRIVSHSPAVTEILFAIGAGDRVIAVDEFSNYPEAAVALQQVRYSDPDPEQAVALEPDLVIFAGRQQGSIEAFRALGLPVFFNEEPSTIEGVLTNIMLIGRLVGEQDAAEVLVAEMRGRIDAIAKRVADVQEGPTVFYELTDGLYTVGTDSFIGGMLTLLKARNIAAGAQTAFPQLTAEVVVERNPQVILLADGAFGVTLDSLKKRPGWAKIAAVESGRVVAVDPDTSSRPGPRIVDALEAFAKALYPERFQ